jgi:small subunit ribosomal protein S9
MFKKFYATGKRKNAIAKVWLVKGSGLIYVNQKEIKSYFKSTSLHNHIYKPLTVVNLLKTFNIMSTVKGGGVSGQASAIGHGISKALVNYKVDLKNILKSEGLIKRDSRVVERKKYGQAGARKKFQHSKR